MDTLLAAKFIGYLLLPPGGLLLLLAAGWLVVRRRPWAGRMLIGLSLLALFLLCSPWFSDLIRKPLEIYPPLSPLQTDLNGAQAIVVLGGGRQPGPEYGGETVSSYSLERIRYAATLQQRTGLPLLLAGGHVFDEPLSEAVLMKQVLVDEYKVPVVWTEEQSRNTYENALFSKKILATAGIDRVFLVTHAWHMRRAVHVFDQLDMQALPAPTGFRPAQAVGIWSFMPSAAAFLRSVESLREYLGLAWYRIRYR